MNGALLADFDNLVADAKSREWLGVNQLLPSQWELSEPEKLFIRRSRIALRVFNSPSFVYDFSLYPVVNNGVLYLIFFDADLVQCHGLSKREAIAVILHEIGHVINRLGRELSSDNDADDYVRHCGFGGDLVSGLQLLIKAGLPGFNMPENIIRVRRITENHRPNLHFLNRR